MTQKKHQGISPVQPVALAIRIFIGAATGLLLICFFVLPIEQPDPAWGDTWMIRPLIITPLAGALAGLCQYGILHLQPFIGINCTVAIILSVLVSLVGLWMGIIAGLDGTLWN